MYRIIARATALMVMLAIGLSAAAVERREIGQIVAEDIPEIPARVGERIRRYQNTRSASMRGWLPGGDGILIATRFAETTQIHHVARSGGARRQLTFFDEPVGNVALRPGHRQFLFTMDAGGGEFDQVFLFDIDDGSHRLLSDGKSRNGSIAWNNAGDAFAYFSTRRNGRDWDILLAKADAPDEPVTVLEAEGTWLPLDFSPDDQRLLVMKYISANDSEIHILDLKTGSLQHIADAEEPVAFGSAAWAPDGRKVFLSSDHGSDFTQLRLHDPDSGKTRVLTADIPWDIGFFRLSADRRIMALTANEDGIDRLYLLNPTTLERRAVGNLPDGQLYGLHFDPGGHQLGLSINTASSPGDVWVIGLHHLMTQRWTRSEIGGLDDSRFVSPQLIRYPTFDTVDGKPRMIPAFYFRPPGEGPFPVIVSIHGGPESQYGPRFSYTTQYYLNELNAAVILPNVRGSSGYGKEYLKLDNGYLREDSVRDIGALLDWIATREELDADRVAVRGGSYGGYMTLASMIHFGERLRCGVDVVGISNFVSFLEGTEDYRRDLRRPEYGDERDPQMREFLQRISPTTRAAEIDKPMFVAQGLNDPRVPVLESEQLVAAMRANGQKVWYMLARDEGHGFAKKSNSDFYTSAQAYFLEQCLLGDGKL